MQYFKHIEIDNYQSIQENSKRFVLDNYLDRTQSGFRQFDWDKYIQYCPEILTAFARYDLVPFMGYVYSIYTQDSSPLHLDYISDVYNKCRINIPILNCEYSKTFFYKKTVEDVKYNHVIQNNLMVDPNNSSNSKFISYIKFDVNDPSLEKIDEVVLDRPTIMRVQEPHRVMINEEHVPRIVLTIHTHKDPVYLLENETC